MEYLQQYSDESDDTESVDIPAVTKTLTEKSEEFASTAVTVDYLGLNSSSDDEEVEYENKITVTKTVTHNSALSVVDTLVNAYQLSQTELGPKKKPFSESKEGSRCHRPVKRRRQDSWRQARPKSGIQIYDVTKREQPVDGTDIRIQKRFSIDRELSVVHPSVAQWLDATPESHLPGYRSKITLTGHRGCVNTLEWGQPTWSHLLLSASMDGTVRIWSGISGSSRDSCLWFESPHNGAAIRCARWSSDGRSLVSGGYDKTARLTYIEKVGEGISWLHPHFVTCVMFHPQTEHLIVTSSQGQINCWDIRKGNDKCVMSFCADFNEVQDIAFLNGGNELICCTNSIDRDAADKTIMAWDFRSGAILSNQIFQERYHCTRLRVHPSKKWFVSQTNGNYVAVFSTTRPYKMNKKKRFEGHKVEGYWIGCDLSKDGRYLYSGSSDGSLFGYSFQCGSLIKCWPLSDQPCLAVECHPLLPGTVAVSGYDGKVFVCQ